MLSASLTQLDVFVQQKYYKNCGELVWCNLQPVIIFYGSLMEMQIIYDEFALLWPRAIVVAVSRFLNALFS